MSQDTFDKSVFIRKPLEWIGSALVHIGFLFIVASRNDGTYECTASVERKPRPTVTEE